MDIIYILSALRQPVLRLRHIHRYEIPWKHLRVERVGGENALTSKPSGATVNVWGYDSSFQVCVRLPPSWFNTWKWIFLTSRKAAAALQAATAHCLERKNCGRVKPGSVGRQGSLAAVKRLVTAFISQPIRSRHAKKKLCQNLKQPSFFWILHNVLFCCFHFPSCHVLSGQKRWTGIMYLRWVLFFGKNLMVSCGDIDCHSPSLRTLLVQLQSEQARASPGATQIKSNEAVRRTLLWLCVCYRLCDGKITKEKYILLRERPKSRLTTKPTASHGGTVKYKLCALIKEYLLPGFTQVSLRIIY